MDIREIIEDVVPDWLLIHLGWLGALLIVPAIVELLEGVANVEADVLLYLFVTTGTLLGLVFIYAMYALRKKHEAERWEQEIMEKVGPDGLDNLPPVDGPRVEFILEEERLIERAAALLNDSSLRAKQLDYYGGVGFIGANKSMWRDTLLDKIKHDKFTVHRYFDFKTIEEMNEVLRGGANAINEARRAKLLSEYLRWIHDQAKVAADPEADNNHFIQTEAAPMWQWGIHLLVFGCTHYLIAFIHKGARVGIVVEDEPEGAEELSKALFEISEKLGRSIGPDEFVAHYNEGLDWYEQHLGRYFSENVRGLKKLPEAGGRRETPTLLPS